MVKLIKEIKDRLFIVENIFINTSESELQFKVSKIKWSKKEILGHLIDSAQNNIRKIVIGRYKVNENIVYDQDIWVKAADYQKYNTSDLIDLFVLLNKHLCIVMQNLPNNNFQSLTNWRNNEPDFISLEQIANYYLRHLDHHINQLR